MLSFSNRLISLIRGLPRFLRTTLPPRGNGRPVFSYHHTPRSTTSDSPWFWNVSWPSWMMSPASYSPCSTAFRISSNGNTAYCTFTPGAMSANSRFNVRNAVVSVPGTAIVMPGRSFSTSFFFDTIIGPYLSPMLHPLGNRAYLSSR